MTAGAAAGRARWVDPAGIAETDSAWLGLLVGQALQRLSAPERAAILQAVYRRRTTGQIAADLHVSQAVVKHRLHSALHSLRLTLNE